MKKLLIIKTGSSDAHVINKCGDCDMRIAQCVGIPYEEICVISVYENAVPILPDDIGGIIITGSPSMVTDLEPWGVATAQWLKQVVNKNIPVLDINCLPIPLAVRLTIMNWEKKKERLRFVLRKQVRKTHYSGYYRNTSPLMRPTFRPLPDYPKMP